MNDMWEALRTRMINLVSACSSLAIDAKTKKDAEAFKVALGHYENVLNIMKEVEDERKYVGGIERRGSAQG